jgi:hypothetical protein
MTLSFLAHPATAYAAAAAGLAVCAALFLFAQLEIGTQARRSAGRERETLAALEDLCRRITELEEELAATERRNATLVAPQAPRPGLNLSVRAQALRMHRRGDPPDRISAELRVPRGEVELLLKVHRILMQNL